MSAYSDADVDLKRHLFYETSHSPSLIDLVGYEKAKSIVISVSSAIPIIRPKR